MRCLPTLLITILLMNDLKSHAGYGREKRFLSWGGGGGGGQPFQMDLTSLLQGLGPYLGGGLDLSKLGGLGLGNLGGSGGNNLGFGGGNRGGGGNAIGIGGGVDAPSTGGGGGDYHQVALDVTNQYRQKHGAAPLTLDAKLSQDCQAWAETLAQSGNMKHSCSMCNDYGENLWMMGGRTLEPAESARKAVKAWYDEVKMYNWNNPGFSGSTGHFTALVWKGTQKMGIGLATNKATRSTYVVARYVPPGNMQGAFKENVGPLQ